MPDPLVVVERAGAVTTLTLNRPERYNAFDPGLVRGLRQAVDVELEREETRALVLTGAGKAFCAGGDVASMRERLESDPKALFLELTGELHRLIMRVRTGPKPVVAAINGPVAGGGFGLALACDWRVAVPAATFKPAYARLGIVPDGGLTYLLPRIAGWGIANRIVLEDASVGARDAHRWGIVDEVIDAKDLLSHALERASTLAALPPRTFAETKRLLNESILAGLTRHLEAERHANAESAARPALKEGVAAFFEKRPPRFA